MAKRSVNSSEAGVALVISDLDEKIEHYESVLRKLKEERRILNDSYVKLYGRTYNPNEQLTEEDPIHGLVRATGEETKIKTAGVRKSRFSKPAKKSVKKDTVIPTTKRKSRILNEDDLDDDMFPSYDQNWSVKDKILWAVKFFDGKAGKDDIISVLGDADKTNLSMDSIKQNYYAMIKRGFLSKPDGYNGRVTIISATGTDKKRK